jgi:membrane protein YdbS with pleckstrin-like domain
VTDEPTPPPPPATDVSPDRQLDPRYVDLERMRGWIIFSVIAPLLSLGLLILFLAADVPGWTLLALLTVAAAIVALLVWSAVRWPALEFAHASYRIDDRGIEIRWGVFWRQVINVPRSRIQHTDVSQGPLERKFGLGTLVIYTAGISHAQVDLPGLAHEDALIIRDYLLPRELPDAV